MSSPVAHSLAGALIYFTSRRKYDARDHVLWLLILAATIADFDLIPSLIMSDHSLFHRTFSHSIPAAFLFALFVYAICRWRKNQSPGRIALLTLTAYSSQLLLDWLSLDSGPPAGIPLFWPFSDTHYIADSPVFLNIERNNLFSASTIIHNTKAVLLELAILGPLAALAWWWNREK